MRAFYLTLAIPLTLTSCIPEGSGPQSATPQSQSAPAPAATPPPSLTEDRLKDQGERISRLETELHEMRLLFTNQLKRIEEVANRPAAAPAQAYLPQQQPQQVVIMPNNPVVTHRWDEQGGQYPATASTHPRAYRVQSGDTLSEIAEAHGISLGALLTANPGTDPLRLPIGKQLTIPSASQAANYMAELNTRARTYTVQSGDTLSEIAERYGVGLSQLLGSNPGIDPSRLRIGKKLNIPSVRSQSQPQQGYASPPMRSLQQRQQEPQSTPQSSLTPQYKSTPAKEEPTQRILIRVPNTTTFGEVAAKVGTDVETLNRINKCALSANSRILANGTIYVPAPEN
ncbi:LysM peptidoglycan-binding domain-containing protein [Roseibacillus persicicus]|uniref:LysM peptidoglycan-binding domain-containing protein n=1 Tax=Roseibacillus persicicus TaxID=454148 RepID=UPI00398B10A6